MKLNTKKLGKKQVLVLQRMVSEQLVIRSVSDAHDGSEDINLQDEEGDNRTMPKLRTLSRTFLKGHPRAGEKTYFVERFLCSVGIDYT